MTKNTDTIQEAMSVNVSSPQVLSLGTISKEIHSRDCRITH